MLRRLIPVAAIAATVLSACSSVPATPAVVDGVEFTGEQLAALSPDRDREPVERIQDLNLLILHEILTTRAASEFDLVASEEQVAAAFDERIRGNVEDVAEWLANRGSTPDRVRLEAELDVIRSELEHVMVESDEYGFDIDAAYRTFLGVNSRVCLRALAVTDPDAVATVEAGVQSGDDIEALAAAHPDSTEIVDLGCNIPVEHGPLLSPVAVDGEVGVAYIREASDGTKYVVEVTERDAPAAEDVMEEVLQIGRDDQGPKLFDAWVIERLKAADVEVDDSIGVWGSSPDTGDIPSVMAG